MDDKAQISAEMILIMGALIVLVVVAGLWISNISKTVAGNVSTVVDAAKDSTINKM
jgi:hypothetical protein